jgi:hypothetical protein
LATQQVKILPARRFTIMTKTAARFGERHGTRRAAAVAAVLLAAAILGSEGTAQAFCRLPSKQLWPKPDGVPVFLNTHLTSFICSGDCGSFDDLRRTVQIALSKIFDQSGSRLRFFYAGDVTRNFNDHIAGAVHVTLHTKECSAARAANADCKVSGTTVKSCRLEFCANKEWHSFFPSELGETSTSFQGVLIHELLHTAGLDHPENCGETTASALTPGFLPALHSTHLFEGDATALRELYGARTQGAFAFKSSDGLTWQVGPAPPITVAASALHSPAGCGAGTDSPILVSYPSRFGHAVELTRFNGLSWTNPTTLREAVSPYPTAAACASAADQIVAWQGEYNQDSGNAFLFVSRTLDGGATFMHQRLVDTAAPGVAAAFDPASQRYIAVQRTAGAGVLFSQVVPDGEPNFHFFKGLQIRSAEPASLACADPAIVGEDNCLITWVSTNWDRFLFYAFGRVAAAENGTPAFQFDLANLYAEPVPLFGPASVTHVRDPKVPWQLVSHQGNGTVVALHKQAGHSLPWEPAPPVEFGPSFTSAITSPLGASLSAVRAPSRFAMFLSGFASKN